MNIAELKKEFSGCACGRAHTTALEDVVVDSGVTAAVGEILQRNGFGRKLHVVADENTLRAAAGIERALGAFDCTYTVYPDCRVASMDKVRALETAFAGCDGVLSVGTGSVNDVCRLAAARAGRPLAIFATAPSMDGFASAGAPIVDGCFKLTYTAASPRVVMADTRVLAASPAYLKSAGFGDMMGKYVGLADWRVSRLVSGEYYCDAVASLTEEAVRRVVSMADRVTAEDEAAAAALMEALLLTGIGMAFTGNSRPASGTEHTLAHYWECKKLERGDAPAFHGAEVAVATLEIIRLYKDIVKHERVREVPERTDWAAVYRAYDVQRAEIEKLNNPSPLTELAPGAVQSHWADIREEIGRLPDPGALDALYLSAGCARRVADIGVDEVLEKQGIEYHPYMRHRISLMRLLPMLELR